MLKREMIDTHRSENEKTDQQPNVMVLKPPLNPQPKTRPSELTRALLGVSFSFIQGFGWSILQNLEHVTNEVL